MGSCLALTLWRRLRPKQTQRRQRPPSEWACFTSKRSMHFAAHARFVVLVPRQKTLLRRLISSVHFTWTDFGKFTARRRRDPSDDRRSRSRARDHSCPRL